MRKVDVPAVPVVVCDVQQRDVPLYLNGIGTVQGFNTVTVRSRVDGQIEKILFEEGQDVKAGDVLARIDARPFKAALAQAIAKRQQDEALLENAQLDLKRDLTLLQEKAGTAQKADTQKALVAQLEAALKADDAAIEAARVQLDYTTLRSPIAGRTGIRIVDEGNVVRSGDAGGVVVVTQMKPISVVFNLSEQHLPSIQTQKGKLGVLALGRDNTTLLAEGVLSVVDNQIDSTTGTIRLKGTFPNESLELWPGQFVNIRLRLSVAANALVVPAVVVQRGPVGAYVYVVKADDSVELRVVKVAQIEDGGALIEEGLKQGERVVVDGQYRLQPGSKVKVTDSAMRSTSPEKPAAKH
ncbi:MAG: efflux RND transporter periplasmic adaptor subunit [Verrucomicrobiota bacterium]